jgi:hypothetical protein
MTDEINYFDESIFPTRGLLPEVDKARDRKIEEQLENLDLKTFKCYTEFLNEYFKFIKN